MRRPLSSKSGTCTEGAHVDAAGISAKVGAHYPGRSANLPPGRKVATETGRWKDGRAEVSRGHSRLTDRVEGPNMLYGIGAQSLEALKRRRRPRIKARRLSGWQGTESPRVWSGASGCGGDRGALLSGGDDVDGSSGRT